MGQSLMDWMAPAGSLFEEMGSQARDRRHASAARHARAQAVEPGLPATLTARTAFTRLASFWRLNRSDAQLAACCAPA